MRSPDMGAESLIFVLVVALVLALVRRGM